MNFYSVKPCSTPYLLSGQWDHPAWQHADTFSISNFLQESSDHRPLVQVKLMYDDRSIHVFFKVNDRYVRSTSSGYLNRVCNDSCVEWFVQLRPDKGYHTFEINCGGSLYSKYVEDPERQSDKTLRKSTFLPHELFRQVSIFHSMPAIVEPEIIGPTEWLIELNVPLCIFEYFVGPIGRLSGQEWRANFNKCGDQTSHPHWATWSPITEKNFHRPQEFGKLVFL
jgi:Carbohydrate-binding family 9